MTVNQKSIEGRSVLRSILAGASVVGLAAMGQWIAALVLSVAYGGADVLARTRRSLRRRSDAVPETQAASSAAPDSRADVLAHRGESGTPRDHDMVVERRPRPEEPTKEPENEEKQSSGGILGPYHRFMERHPRLKAFINKLGKDNVGMLAGNLSWNLLTSMVPLIVGLVAITGAVVRDPATRNSVVDHLAAATQGFSRQDIEAILKGSGQHAGLLGLIGLLGVLWGGSNVGGAISTVFQAIFEVRGRPFLKEKLIDIGMIFVFAALMIVIILGSTAGALLSGLFAHVPVPGVAQAIGIGVDLIAAFLLFAAIYLVFPNIETSFRIGNVWKGAAVAAVLFTILSQVWGIYANFQHFSKYGQVVSVLLILAAWIYFFSVILVLGAEVVAFGAIEEAKKEGESVGPAPEESVPQHEVLRTDPAVK